MARDQCTRLLVVASRAGGGKRANALRTSLFGESRCVTVSTECKRRRAWRLIEFSSGHG